MNLKNLAELKKKLIHATDFQPVMEYFWDEFGDHEAFLGLGRPVRSGAVEHAIKEIGRQVFPSAAALRIDRLLLIELAEHHFIHGGFLLNGCMSVVIYFTDLQMGLIAVAMSASGETRLARFSARRAPPGPQPSEN